MSEVVVTQKIFDEIVEAMQLIKEYIKNPPLKDEEEIWIDSQEVCNMLGISIRTLQRRRNEFAIPYTKDGSSCYYLPSEIDKALRKKIIKCADDKAENFRLNYINNAGQR